MCQSMRRDASRHREAWEDSLAYQAEPVLGPLGPMVRAQVGWALESPGLLMGPRLRSPAIAGSHCSEVPLDQVVSFQEALVKIPVSTQKQVS